MRYLFIAEKPSLMKEIKAVYQEIRQELKFEADFACFSGHIVRLAQPNEYEEYPQWQGQWTYDVLPLKPSTFKLCIMNNQVYENLVQMIQNKSYDCIVNACDPDREGQHIFYLFQTKAGWRLPVKRFWSNDLTFDAVKNALKGLKDNNQDIYLNNLTKASYLRAHFDWLVGMNMSRACSISMGITCKIGRVKTPTLGLLVNRELAILNFKPKTVFEVVSIFSENFSATLIEDNKVAFFENQIEAAKVIQGLSKTAKVKSVLKKPVNTYAPALLKLSTAQIECSKQFGMNAEDTLAACQFLYEQKIITYPRTDCEHVSTQAAKNFKNILEVIKELPECKPFVEQISQDALAAIINNKKYVNDEELLKSGHSALLLTGSTPDFSKLEHSLQTYNLSHHTKIATSDIQNLFMLLAKRILAIFLPPKQELKSQIIIENAGKIFVASGKVIINKGFTALFEQKLSEIKLPDLAEGQELSVNENTLHKKVSQCPVRFTDGTLIAAMENPAAYLHDQNLKNILKEKQGIGTPATRANILKELEDNQYIERQKSGKAEYLKPTAAGIKMIENLKDKDITSVDLTGTWEERLAMVERGELDKTTFQQKMEDYVISAVEDIKTSGMTKIEKDNVGKCPVCEGNVYEGENNYYCSNYKKGCKFTLWKNDKYLSQYYNVKKITLSMAKQILEKRKLKISKEAYLQFVVKENGLSSWKFCKKGRE